MASCPISDISTILGINSVGSPSFLELISEHDTAPRILRPATAELRGIVASWHVTARYHLTSCGRNGGDAPSSVAGFLEQ